MNQQLCLYCGRGTGPFTSREHVIPEGLGNNPHTLEGELCLDRGVVCDPCNHGVLSQLDDTLLNFDPIAMVRVFEGIRTKKGQWPTARMGDVTIQRTTQTDILVRPQHKRVVHHRPDGFNMKVRGRKPATEAYLRSITRALYKVALGLIYVDHERTSLHQRFDPMRQMIMGEKFHGYLILGHDATPRRQVSFTYDFLQCKGHPLDTVWIQANVYGVRMYTDVDIRDTAYVTSLFPRDNILSF